MNTSSDRELLEAYLTGELSREEAAAVESRLKTEPHLCELLVTLAQEETVLSEWARATSQANGMLFDPYHEWLGIPPKQQPPNHYRLLGLEPFESDPTVIGNAADQRMAHLRNFQSGKRSGQSQRLLNEVASARVCLLDPLRKAEYDQQLRHRIQSETTPISGGHAVPSFLDNQRNRFLVTGAAIAASVAILVVAVYMATTSGDRPVEPDVANAPTEPAAVEPEPKLPEPKPKPEPTPEPASEPAPIEEPNEAITPEVPESILPEKPTLVTSDPPPEISDLPDVVHTPVAPNVSPSPNVPLPVSPTPVQPTSEAVLAEKLLALTLDLSQASNDVEQVWIYQQMASNLLANAAHAKRTDPSGANSKYLLANYVQVMQEGVLPRLAAIPLADPQGRVRGVAGYLRSDCEVLESLAATEATPVTPTREALALSSKCRAAAESLLTKRP